MKGTAHQHQRAEKAYHAALGDGNFQALTPADMLGFDELLVILDTGVFGGTSPTLDVKLQEGDASNGSDAVDISGAVFSQKTDSAGDDSIFVGRINLANRKRYIRCHGTITGTSPTGEVAVIFVKSMAKDLPVSQVATAEFSIA